MGMFFALVNSNGNSVEALDSLYEFGVTYGTASKVLEAIGRPGGLIREDGEWDYFVEFDPTFLVGACERAIAENRDAYGADIKRSVEGQGSGVWVFVRQLLELAEDGVMKGARAIQGG